MRNKQNLGVDISVMMFPFLSALTDGTLPAERFLRTMKEGGINGIEPLFSLLFPSSHSRQLFYQTLRT